MSATIERDRTVLVDRLRQVLPAERIATAAAEIAALTRDQSWLSPALTSERRKRQANEGAHLGVQAAVAPRSVEELAATVAIAAGERTPITLRGAGTSNFGLIDPGAGGLLIDLRGLIGEIAVGDGAIRAPAGTLLGDMERVASAHGAEIPILTTTYATATVAGWVAGGHVGLGSSSHGAIWDGAVRSVRLMTIEESPRILTLSGAEVEPVLHSFGVTGILVDVELATAPRRQWLEAVGAFPSFAHASAFTTDISQDVRFAHRVVAAQEEAAAPGLRALASVIGGDASVLAILDEAQFDDAARLAQCHGGRLVAWQRWTLDQQARPSIAALVYGHRMYWVKRLFPDASFLHVYLDPHHPDRDLTLLKQCFGDDLLIENKFIRSPWMLKALGFDGAETLPAAVVAVREGSDGGTFRTLLDVCGQAGIVYQNPHVRTIEENGLFGDVAPIVALKAQADPFNLVHRGRLASARQAA